jgi:hypothetical protein
MDQRCPRGGARVRPRRLGFNIGVGVFGALTAGYHRACYFGANAASTVTAPIIASPVTVAMQAQAGELGKAQRSRAPLLTAHADLAIRPKRNARKLFKRSRQGTVFICRLVEQAATIEGIGCRAKRRRNLRAGLIQAGSGSGVIRCRLLSGASGKGGRRVHHDHLSHAVNLGPAVDHFKQRGRRTCGGGHMAAAVRSSIPSCAA